MSARPRPVTATFKPPEMAPPTGVRTRSYSLSSGSSTASLISILKHDSYESLPDSDVEPSTHENKLHSDLESKLKLEEEEKEWVLLYSIFDDRTYYHVPY